MKMNQWFTIPALMLGAFAGGFVANCGGASVNGAGDLPPSVVGVVDVAYPQGTPPGLAVLSSACRVVTTELLIDQDRSARELVYHYDASGRVSGIDGYNLLVSHDLSRRGLDGPASKTSYTYDELGRVTRVEVVDVQISEDRAATVHEFDYDCSPNPVPRDF
jgi:YD repeat-containing protein